MFDVYGKTAGVSLSTPFLIKSRCKYCASLPTTYYNRTKRALIQDPSKFVCNYNMTDIFYRFIKGNYYHLFEPKQFTTLRFFVHSTQYKGYLPKIHNTRGRPPYGITEFLMCECGKTSWGFTDKSIQECPEIVNRKAKSKYPILK